MTYAWFVLFQRCASHRIMHMSYRSKTYTWTDVILVKRSMIRVLFIVSHSSCFVTWYACGQLKFNYRIANYTWPDTRTMVLWNSRSIQKHRRPIKVQLSYREWHVTGRAQWYCGTREVSRSIEDRLKFNYHIANDTWPDAHNGIAELEKYPEASKTD